MKLERSDKDYYFIKSLRGTPKNVRIPKHTNFDPARLTSASKRLRDDATEILKSLRLRVYMDK